MSCFLTRSFSLLFVLSLFFSWGRAFASYEEELLEELILAEPGDVIEIPEGFHEIKSQLSLMTSGVTLRGKGPDKSILSFKNQSSGAEGLYVSASDVVLEGFSILDTRGDSIKVINSRNIIFRNLKVGWTGEPSTENGGYGLYPVRSENILVEDCEAFGASDAGIYVGQSENIIVRGNYLHHNVSGIEIENSENADVYENLAESNAAGILVFNLPGLSRYGKKVRVFRNRVQGNNWENFSSEGNIIAVVPRGTGIMVMSYESVEVFSNLIYKNQSTAFLVVSYFSAIPDANLPEDYDPIPKSVSFYQNVLNGNGYKPEGGASSSSRDTIELLKGVLGETFPDAMYDAYKAINEEGTHENPHKICLSSHDTNQSFVALDLEFNLQFLSRKKRPYICQLDKLEPVTLPFLEE